MFDFESELKDLLEEKIYECIPGKKIRQGRKINCRCFICGDSRKSSRKMRGWFYLDTCSYSCFNEGCTASGIYLLSLLTQTSKSDVKSEIINRLRVRAKRENKSITDYSKSVKKVKEELESKPKIEKTDDSFIIPDDWIDLPPAALNLVSNRRIQDAPYKPSNWNLYYSKKENRIVIPWTSYGEIDTYQLRAILKTQVPKYKFPFDSTKTIFGLDQIDYGFEYVYYCEGAFDSIWFKNCLAIGGLHPNNDQQQELSETFFDKQLVWAPDNPWVDTASKKAIIKHANKNPKGLVFMWDKTNTAKDFNEDVIISNNLKKYTDPSFLRKHVIPLYKAKIQLLFDK